MIIGNFCLLTGIDPNEVDQWYLGVYIDAIEWVEMPNTRGMSQFADDAIIATKPYAASGNYINKMSDYCKNCHYDVKQKVGEKACPYNSLYWQFMDKHRALLEKNPRIGMVYRNWDKQTPQLQQQTLAQANYYLTGLKIQGHLCQNGGISMTWQVGDGVRIKATQNYLGEFWNFCTHLGRIGGW